MNKCLKRLTTFWVEFHRCQSKNQPQAQVQKPKDNNDWDKIEDLFNQNPQK